MSYFFSPAGNNRCIKITRKKHSHRNLSNDRHIETQGHKHLWKYSTTKKCILKPKYFIKDSLTSSYNGKVLPPKNRNKSCLHNEIVRLVMQNRLLLDKIKKIDLDLANVSAVKKRDKFKLRKKYKILKQSYFEIQAEHDKINVLLAQRENDFSQLRKHCDKSGLINQNFEQKLNSFVTAIQTLKNEKFQLNKDVILLKNLVYRLNVEIEKYQDKLSIVGQKTDSQAIINVIDKVEGNLNRKNILKIWSRVDLHALGPLLDSYQENINEKDELINKYKIELDNFTTKVMAILTENENLHDEIANSKEQRHKCINKMKFAKEDVAITQEQNDLFCEQITVQKRKIQEIHCIYEQNVKSISQYKDKLHKDYLTCKTKLSNFECKYEILSESYKKLKINLRKTIPMSVHNTAIEECKRLFEELKQQYKSEKEKLNICITHSAERQPEKEKQLIMVTEDRNQLGIQVKILERNLKRAQRKFEHLHNVVHSIQLSRTSFKQELNKTAIYCEELLIAQEKLIKEKNKLIKFVEQQEKENKDIQNLGSNIAHRLKTLKSQLMIIQEATKELASVKEYIKTQVFDVDQIKIEFQREISRLKQLLYQKEETIRTLQREKFTIQENLEYFWKTASSDGKKV